MQSIGMVLGVWTLFAVCPQSTMDHACYEGRNMNMPMFQYRREEACEWDRVYYTIKYPHIHFECTIDYPWEISWKMSGLLLQKL